MARKLDPEKHEQRRIMILEAALACFARDGFHSTSTAKISSEAGISSGNLFHYFDSKDAIIEAIVAEEVKIRGELFAKLKNEGDVVASIVGLFRSMMSLASDTSYNRISTEVFAEALRNPAIAKILASDTRALSLDILELLQNGLQSGQIDADLDLEKAALWIIAITDGATARVAVDSAFNPEDHIEVLTQLISKFLSPRA